MDFLKSLLFDGILIPIIGVIAGAAASAVFDKTNQPYSNGNIQSNINQITGNNNQVSNANHIDNSKTVHHHHHHHGARNSQDAEAGIALLIIISVVGVVVAIAAINFYSLYAPNIFFSFSQVVHGIAALSLSFCAIGIWRNVRPAHLYFISAGLALTVLGIVYLHNLPLLIRGYNPAYAEYARSYGPKKYFDLLPPEARQWIAAQIVGVGALSVPLLGAAILPLVRTYLSIVGVLVVSLIFLYGSHLGATGEVIPYLRSLPFFHR